MDICRKPELLRDVLVLGLIFFAANYEYYGSIFGVEALSTSIYLNSLQQPICEMLGNFITGCVIANFKRKNVFYTGFVLFCAYSIGLWFLVIPDECKAISASCSEKYIQTFIAALIKWTATTMYGVLFVYYPEIFPVEFRALCMGISSFISRVGNTMAPYLNALLVSKDILPQVSYVVSGVLGIVTTCFAKETYEDKEQLEQE